MQIDFEVKQPSIGVRLRFLAKNKKMKSKAAKILAYTAIAATASMENGSVNRYIEETNDGPATNYNTHENLSPRMAKARKLRKQLKRQTR